MLYSIVHQTSEGIHSHGVVGHYIRLEARTRHFETADFKWRKRHPITGGKAFIDAHENLLSTRYNVLNLKTSFSEKWRDNVDIF